MSELPIIPLLPEICDTVLSNKTLVLQAQPGAGKSTCVPQALLTQLAHTQGKILLVEPRRVAAKSLAHFLASQCNEAVGKTVGYHVKNDKKLTAQTRLIVMTDGMLVNYCQRDPELEGISVVIMDEFHERSTNTDLGLLLLKQIQDAFNPELAILVMSATINTAEISHYLNGAPIIECEGRQFPVDISYHPLSIEQLKYPLQWTREVTRVLLDEINHSSGDILVFLPGSWHIDKMTQALQHHAGLANSGFANVEIMPLHGNLPIKTQQQVISPANNAPQRIILATNIAESSLTIPRITCVVDMGLEKINQFDVSSGLSRLVESRIDQQSATQRAGRAGRMQPGRCIRLWSQSVNLANANPAEISRCDLSDVVLQLLAWGETPYSAPWFEKPPIKHIEHGMALLTTLGFVSQNSLTAQGQQAHASHNEPRLAAMLLTAQVLQLRHPEALTLACAIITILNEQRSLRMIKHGSKSIELHDYVTLLTQQPTKVPSVHQTFVKLCQRHNAPTQLTTIDDEALCQLLLSAFTDRIAKQRRDQLFTLANGRGVRIPNEASASPWCVVLDCDGQNKDGLVYLWHPVRLAAIETHCEITESHHFSRKNDKLVGRQRRMIQQLVITESPMSDIPADAELQFIKQEIAEQGRTALHLNKAEQDWLQRVQWLHQHLGDDSPLSGWSDSDIVLTVDQWLFPYLKQHITLQQFNKQDKLALLQARLDYQQQQWVDTQAPSHFVTPSQLRCAIRYHDNEPPTVSVQLQELFGLTQSPLLAMNRVPIRFELLSPARRPIQVTSDLAYFWQNSYIEVAKEMRGRYPKHRWPEHPAAEQPGRSIKRKTSPR